MVSEVAATVVHKHKTGKKVSECLYSQSVFCEHFFQFLSGLWAPGFNQTDLTVIGVVHGPCLLLPLIVKLAPAHVFKRLVTMRGCICLVPNEQRRECYRDNCHRNDDLCAFYLAVLVSFLSFHFVKEEIDFLAVANE